MLQRGKASEAHRCRFARRIEHGKHCRHQRDTAGKGDQHAESGYQSQLGKTPIACRQESEKSDGGCRGSECKRSARFLRCTSQRYSQIAEFMPFGTVAHAELNAEVDSKAHE